jgi:acid phosphatase (class A)
MQRATAYGESRVVCGLHFPSDVAAGQALAEAVFAQLETIPAFRRDLARAKAEIDAARARRRRST